MATSLSDRITSVVSNPSLMQQTILQIVHEKLDDANYDITDPTNPFIALTEVSVLNTSAIVNEELALLRKQYPSMALTEEELYLHMSDRDYVGRFATPTTNNFYFLLSVEEVKAKAISTEITGIRKLTIPRFTAVKVGDLTYTMQYPIDIRVMRHGGLQITYDADVTSPVQTLTSNMVDWEEVTYDKEKCIRLKVPVQQFTATSHTIAVNTSTAVDTTFTFEDQYYYCRVYQTTDGTTWKEIRTTHSEQVYDPAIPTVVLKKVNNTLKVRVPIIYTMSEKLTGTLRVDIYTTKGKINTSLDTYTADSFAWSFDGMGDDLHYANPLSGLQWFMVYSDEKVEGGSDGKSFEVIRDGVVNDTLTRIDAPISNLQLKSALENKGFEIVTAVDNVTNRQFLATRQLDAPTDGTLYSSMGTYMGTLLYPFDELAKHPSVIDNGKRITITPKSLFKIYNGVVTIVDEATVAYYRQLGNDALVREANNERFLYSPFYYVLDIADGFDVRAYALDSPKVLYKSLVEANDTSLMSAYIADYHIAKSDTGYLLTFTVEGDETFTALDADNIVAQVSYKPRGENSWAACNATYQGVKDGTRYYQVEFQTKHDLDTYDRLHTTNFTMYSSVQNNFGFALEDNIDITMIVKNQDMTDYKPSDLDRKIQTHLVSSETGDMCVTCERLRIKFGATLDALWKQHRAVISTKDYEVYDADVPYTREDTVYERDEFGNIAVEVVDGKPHFKVKYEKGSVIKDDQGNPIVRYRKGMLKRDSQGNLILNHERSINREFTMLFADGLYYFVTDQEALDYRTNVTSKLMAWVEVLAELDNKLLEQSRLYLHPTQTMGDTKVMVLDGQTTTISIAQSFTVEIFMSDVGFRDTQLRESISKATKRILVEQLNQRTVSLSSITTALKEYFGDNVISTTVSGLGGNLNLTTITMQDDTSRLALGKRLIVKSNHTLAVEDAVDITFIRHSLLT